MCAVLEVQVVHPISRNSLVYETNAYELRVASYQHHEKGPHSAMPRCQLGSLAYPWPRPDKQSHVGVVSEIVTTATNTSEQQ